MVFRSGDDRLEVLALLVAVVGAVCGLGSDLFCLVQSSLLDFGAIHSQASGGGEIKEGACTKHLQGSRIERGVGRGWEESRFGRPGAVINKNWVSGGGAAGAACLLVQLRWLRYYKLGITMHYELRDCGTFLCQSCSEEESER